MKIKQSLPIAATLILAGCGHGQDIPYLGRWHADFVVDKIREGGTAQDLKREGLHGALQIYANHDSFKLHLEGEQEAVDCDGVWSHKDTTAILRFTKVKIDDMGGFDHRNPNLKFIPAPELAASFNRELVLHLSKDKKRLPGLEVSIGHLTGHYIFTRSTD